MKLSLSITALESQLLRQGTFTPTDGDKKGQALDYCNLKFFAMSDKDELLLMVLKNPKSEFVKVEKGQQFKIEVPATHLKNEKCGGRNVPIIQIDFKRPDDVLFEQLPRKK